MTTLVVAYLLGVHKIQSTAIAADNDYKVVAKTEIEQKIKLYSDKYNVSFQKMYNTIDCETAHTFNPQIQSEVKYNFSDHKRGIVKGEQEKSWGLAQIHLPDHPNITLEQATDIDFSLNFMAKEYSKGHNIWYCK